MNVPAIKIGDFNVLAVIEQQVESRDPNWNTPTGVWQPLMAQPGSPTTARGVWAKVQDSRPSRQEKLQQGLEESVQSTYMWIRFLPIPMDTALRVTLHRAWGAEIMQVIGGPAVLGNNEYLEFKLEKYSS